ncbi:hypothetical protein Bpfe_023675 [Biomphalaria pfeifferi]|uniref:Uncharacterized protein n=1 Tax=Biomphalaria pfeifferi TaxID=112525 RepID=A0AAD8F086_BIOPF|nr:hypothetical protein Bpfe_023675 [Biomphalaria pfeifferi]
MSSITLKGPHGGTYLTSGQWKHRRTRTRAASALTSVVTKGHVDQSELLLAVCSGLERLLAIIRYWIRQLSRSRATSLDDQAQVRSDFTAKPLPDLLKDLPVFETAPPCGQPDLLKVHNSVDLLPLSRPAGGQLIHTFQAQTTSAVNFTRGVPPSMGGTGEAQERGRRLTARSEHLRGNEVDAMAQDAHSNLTVTELVEAIRTIGDNLDMIMRDHKEPAVRAIFRNAQKDFGYDLIWTLGHNYVLRVIGSSLELLLIIGRL